MTTPRVFDVAPSLDARNADYPVSAVLTSTQVPRRKIWRRSLPLDQGSEGACVGHGCTAELLNAPARVDLGRVDGLPAGAPRDAQAFAFWLYRAAQRIDEWPGESYSGTSVNAGMKVLRDAGFYSSYRWVNSRSDLVQSLMLLGPVVIAIPWHSGMYEAPGGVLRVAGEQVGWHCLLANGYDPAKRIDGARVEAVRLQNSWGADWGREGCAWIPLDVLWTLLSLPHADAVVPIGRATLHRKAPA